MVFSSVTFLFLFLPIVLALHFIVPKKFRNLLLTCFSLLFYFWGEGYLIWIILFSTLIDYLSGLIISGAWRKGEVLKLNPDGEKSPAQKFGLALSLTVNLGLLGYFKYYNFGVDNLVRFFHLFGIETPMLESIAYVALPLGISFYTFQSMSYTLDVYQGYLKATRSFSDFLCYVTLFPQLVAGPIVRYRDLENELRSRQIRLENVVSGTERFVQGLIKKVLISNTVARVVDTAFAQGGETLHTSLAWAGVIGFIIQLYFDFSGYSDMAIGLGRMLGFHFKENFRWPLISKSYTEFWQRWHISLSSWIRDYVYAPIRRKNRHPSTLGTFRQQFIVFLLIGIWHGAAWNFVVFGLLQGFLVASERTWMRGFMAKAKPWMLRIYFYALVPFCFTIFRSESLSQIVLFIKTLLGFNSVNPDVLPIESIMRPDVVLAYILGIVFLGPVFDTGKSWLLNKISNQQGLKMLRAAYVAALAFLVILSIGQIASGTYNPFIYFRF